MDRSHNLLMVELFDGEYYPDIGMWVRIHLRSFKMVPFESLDTVFYSHSIITEAVSLAISEILNIEE